MGRFNEACDQGRQALEIDPVSPLANGNLGWAFLYAGRIDDAIQQSSKAVELNPNDAWSRIGLGRAYLGKGMGQRAIEEMEVAHRGEPDIPILLGFLGYAYAVTGRRADALKSLETLDEMEKKHYVSRIARVYVCAGLGDKDKSVRVAGEGISGTLRFAGVLSQRSGIEKSSSRPALRRVDAQDRIY